MLCAISFLSFSTGDSGSIFTRCNSIQRATADKWNATCIWNFVHMQSFSKVLSTPVKSSSCFLFRVNFCVFRHTLCRTAIEHLGLYQRFPSFFLATLFPISVRFTRPYTIDFLIYRLHNVGYILKQEEILQRPNIPFTHCKIFSL